MILMTFKHASAGMRGVLTFQAKEQFQAQHPRLEANRLSIRAGSS